VDGTRHFDAQAPFYVVESVESPILEANMVNTKGFFVGKKTLKKHGKLLRGSMAKLKDFREGRVTNPIQSQQSALSLAISQQPTCVHDIT